MNTYENFAHYTAALAQRAVLYEVSTTPKPGLVDRLNNGAHKDMNFFTFLASSTVLYRGFYEFTLEGTLFNEKNFSLLLKKLRPIGIECEKNMFKTTAGVNTHKGVIFSLGIICGVLGYLHKNTGNMSFPAELICEMVRKTAKNITVNDFKNIESKETLTHGEYLYKTYGLKGIRGEVENGFESLRKKALPLMRSSKTPCLERNDLFLEILLNIMCCCEDTNIASRSGIEGLNYAKASASRFLDEGGIFQKNAKEKLSLMNKDFVKKNISPGGSADLLAAAIFLGLIEGILS